MSLQFYSHSKEDLEKIVETVLNKVQNFQLPKTSKGSQKEEFLSQKNACAFLKVSMPTIILWRKEKNLPHYNFNGRYFYSPSELLEYGRKNNQDKNTITL